MKLNTFYKQGAALALCLTLSFPVFAEKDLVQYVNTLQGTNSTYELSWGNTYPTTAVPYPMNSWSPQTGKNGDGWKYQYSATTIRGFQPTHQCSPWVGDYGVFSLMPVSELVVDESKRATPFSHDKEIAKPHYYKVTLENGITTEFSPTTRSAHFRFSFPAKGDAFLVLDGYTKTSQVQIDVANHRITGYVHNGAFSPKTHKNYFIIQFDKPFVSYGTWENRKNTIQKNNLSREGEGIGAYVQFAKGSKVQAKVSTSYISPEQAEVTMTRELGKHSSVEVTKQAAADVWNQLLNRVLVDGGSEEDMKTFYSCMFRANLFSHKFYEEKEDGSPYYYSPYDEKIHDGYMFTDNGFWDTFRSQFPLTNILHPTMQGQYMQALLDAQEQCGWLPSWSFPSETGGMVGNHSISLLTDAWVKGIRTFDPEKALKAYAHEAMNKGPWGGANGRVRWKDYYQLGYIPYPESMGSTAQTLEYCYDDFCAYQLAKMTGNKFYEEVFARQIYNYKNVYDPSVGFMRGRKLDGSWADFDAFEWGGPYCEGNAWHYNWSVFHDVQGLIDLTGGDERFVAKIDSVFALPGIVKYGTYGTKIHEMLEMELAKMGQYAQGNQPIQHMIYLYSYAGQPWKTQYWIRQVMDRLYNSSENGYPGDEDQGGMSSWYVLSALGIYSFCPGTDEYVLGSPKFRKATITMEDGKKFVIEAKGNSKDNVYIQNATLNGKRHTRNYIHYSDIVNGGVLELQMGNQPEKTRGTAKEDRPFSLSK
ncbi:GH92 family glycosyl hydrolase [Parabacteroides sp. D26]|uniref:GH92 family glycosyl hydrolase n=1 Tax=Parabacteroides sp. D26 TaxID=658662 RepID=UPI003565A819